MMLRTINDMFLLVKKKRAHSEFTMVCLHFSFIPVIKASKVQIYSEIADCVNKYSVCLIVTCVNIKSDTLRGNYEN